MSISHRPWPLPKESWVMMQTWHDLLFAHWPIPPRKMRSLVPSPLSLDTYDGQSWLGVVPFWMSGVSMRGTPPIPGLSRFPELNVRTYVTVDGKPGVYFFSLDAGSRLAVSAARALCHLPYFLADMEAHVDGNEVEYQCARRNSPVEFRGSYGSDAPVQFRERGTLEHWLTERYCLYTVHRSRVFRGEVHHLPWPLQDASAEIAENSMAQATGLALPDTQPLLHFAKRLDVLIWPLQRLR